MGEERPLMQSTGQGAKARGTPHKNTVHNTNGDAEADGEDVVEVGGAGVLLAKNNVKPAMLQHEAQERPEADCNPSSHLHFAPWASQGTD